MPLEIAASDPAVVRPRDLRDVYARPSMETRRLSRAGVLLRLAHGYYAIVPEHLRGVPWRPSVEAVGLAIAQRDHGRDSAAAMGPSAARILGAIPRALGEATIATRRQRPPLNTVVGRVRFVARDVSRLDVQRCETELGSGWVTTPEQTVVDLADRPELGHLTHSDLAEAVRVLGDRVDWDSVLQLGTAQRKRPAALEAAKLAGADPSPS